MHRNFAPFALVASLFFAATGSAATDFRVLVDLDNNPSTGCNVNGMAGVDRVLTTTFDASGSSPRVTSLTRQDCNGSSLGSPVTIDGTGWPATANASTGLNIVETRIPLSAFGSPMPSVMRLGFAMTSGSQTVTVLTDSDGNPILFPGTGKRHAVTGNGSNARSFIADGNPGDWAGIDPLANGDASQPNTFRIINVFGFVTNEAVFFRFDEQSQASAPTAHNDTYSTPLNTPLSVTGPGVLGNDTDPNSKPLTAIQLSSPDRGAVALNGDGSFTFTPDGGIPSREVFTYQANNGAQSSNVARVEIRVGQNNHPPNAGDDSYNVVRGGTLTSPAPGVLQNDNDPDGDALHAVLRTSPTHGTLTLNDDGSFTYVNDGLSAADDQFTYVASDGIDVSREATVHIHVGTNNAPPQAVDDNYSVNEGGTLNVAAPGVLTNDHDSDTAPSQLLAVLVTGPLHGTLSLNVNGGFVYTHDGSETTSDSFTYRVSDRQTVSNVATVHITINPVNDPPTAVPDAYLTLAGTPLTVAANGVLANDTDPDSPASSFTASVATAPANGALTLNANGGFTYTPNAGFFGTDTFTYRTSDGLAQSLPATVTITVDKIPVITSANTVTFTVGVFGTFNVTTSGQPAASIAESGALPAGVTFVDGTGPNKGTGVLSGTPGPGTAGVYNITFTATNPHGSSGPQAFTLNIVCPTITITNPASSTAVAGAPFSRTFTQSGGVGVVTFTTASTLPTGLTLASNGTLSGTPTQTGTFPITVTATDSNLCSANSPVYNLTITCQTITVTNPATSTGTIMTPFTQFFTQSGAIGTPVFSTASVLPAGMTLNGLGLLSGLPTQTGTFPITVTVTDANGCTGTSPVYNLVINCQTITVTNPANSNGTAGTAFTQQFTQSGAIGTATFTTASPLPAGLTLSPTGVLSGTPTQTGTFPITVTVTDSNNCTGTGPTYNLVIGCQTISVTNPATNTGTAASPFSQNFTQSGGIGTTTFSTASTLPAGLTLASNGTLSGTPTQTGSFPIVVVATDSNGCTGTGATYTLDIGCQTITVTPPLVGSATINTPFSQNFTQSGAIGTATFTTSSPLPAGLTLAPNGTLSGTPVQGGSFVITVTVTDSNGCTGVSTPYDMFVGCQVITVVNPGTTTGTVSAAFSQQFTATNTVGTTTFSTASTLPTGLTLASDGTLSGTPTQTGSFPINVTATDANGCSGTGPTYTLVIGCQTITVTNPANVPGTVSSPYSVQFTQTGAVGGATFTTASTLPTGLTLSTSGLLSGTPLQAGSFPIVVTVTDGNGCTGTGSTYDLGIGCQVITVNNPATTSSPAGTPLSINFTQSGAVGGATFTTASALPTGLSLATNGTLSGTPTQGGTFPIDVTVTDGNGCTGTSSGYSLTITCPTITVTNPATTTGTVGAAFSQNFTQTGGQGTVTFTTASTLPTGLTLASNGTLAGTPSQFGTFPIVVTATDQNGCTGTGPTYTLVISCPTITVNNPATTTGTANTAFSQTFTQSGGFGAVTFATSSTLPAGLSLSTGGVLSGTPTQTGSFPIIVTVTDAAGCTGTGSPYNLVIGCQTITVNNPGVTTGTVNVPFSQTFTQTNAIGSVTFTTASTLPNGLSLASDGTLAGTPTQNGTFPIVVTVTDSNGCTGTGSTYNLVIACQVIGITPTSIPGGTVGAPYSVTYTASNFIGTVTWGETGALPSGVTFNNATGVLSGTPIQPGTFPILVSATDSNGCSSVRSYSLGISCETITVTNPTNTTGTVASPFSEQFTQSGALPGATFSTASTLPTGLTLNPTTGVLSGTPTQSGTFPITVTVTDPAPSGCQGTGPTYTLVISCNTITVTNPATNVGTAGTAFSATFTQTGGNGTITWSETGALPTGITLNTSTGVLSGTTSQTGSFPITVTATDGNGCSGNGGTYTLTINCQTISITNPAQTSVQAGTAFSGTFTATGILGTATWSETGALPTGITLNSATGVLSGTSTQQGSFPITVKVTDTNGCFGTSSYTLTVTCPVITVTRTGGGSFPAGTIGNAYTGQSFTASPAATYTFAVSSGTFPPGLSLATNGTISGTPTATGTFLFDVTATDVALCTGTASFSIAINPTALADSYGTVNQLVNNTQAVVTGGLTTSPATPFVALTGTLINNDLPAGGVAATAGTFQTVGTGVIHGSVTIATDGTFIYTPPVTAAPLTTDSFTYTITSNTGGTATPTSATGTATLTLLGRVWYVKNDAAGGGNGQSQSPFNTLVPFKNNARLSPDTTGDTIFIFTGDGTTTNMTTGVQMLNNESLIGNGVALVMNGHTLVTAGTMPQITDTDPTVLDVVHLADGDTVRGLTLTGGLGAGIRGVAGPANFTGDTLIITNNAAQGVVFDTTTGAATLTNVSISGNTSSGLAVANGSIAVSVDATSSIASSSGVANSVVVSGHATGLVTIAATITDTAGGISIQSNTSGTISFTGSQTINGGNINAVNISGNAAAVTINFSGTLNATVNLGSPFNATGAGTLNVSNVANLTTTTGGTAVINGLTVGASGVTFNTVHLNGGFPNVNLTNVNGLVTIGNGTTASTISNGNGGITLQGLTTSLTLINTTMSGSNLAITNTTNFGTLTLTNDTIGAASDAIVLTGGTLAASGSSINAPSGRGLILNTVTASGTPTFTSVTSGFGANNIGLTTVTGNLALGNGALSGSTGGAAFFISGGSGNVSYAGSIVVGATSRLVDITGHTGGTITLSGSLGNVGASGLGIRIQNSTNSNTYTFSGSQTLGTSGSRMGSTAVTLAGNNSTTTFTFNGVMSVFTTGVTAFTATGPAGGTINFNGTNSIDAASGSALVLNGVNLGTGAFTGIASTGGVNGISLTTVTGGTLTIGGGGSLSGNSGSAFLVSGGSPTVSYAGNITQNTAGQKAVDISGITGGGVDLSGAIGSTGGAGIAVAGTGGTVNFTGAITLSGTASVFSASGAGLTISATNVNSTIGTPTAVMTAAALSITNATIGAGNVKFKSISAGTAASGPVNAIVLNNTGSTGGLIVTGTGAAGTGGTIQKTTGDSILLTSTKNLDLSFMNIQNSSAGAINGTGVNGFSLTSCSITGNVGGINSGSTAAVILTDTTNAVSFVNDTVTGTTGVNGFNVQLNSSNSSTAAITTLTVTGGSYSSAAQNGGFLINQKSTAKVGAAFFSNVTFSGNFSKGLQLQQNDNSVMGDSTTAPLPAWGGGLPNGSITVTGCHFTNNNVAASFEGGGGTGGTGSAYYRFVNNLDVNGSHSVAVNFANGSDSGGGTYKAFVSGNTVGTAGANSGSAIGGDMRFFMQGQQSAILTIQNNTLRACGFNGRGIDVEALGRPGAGFGQTPLSVKITGNDVNPQDTSGFPLYAIYVGADAQGTGSSGSNVTAEIHGNTVPSTPSACDTQCGGNVGMIFYETVGGATGTTTGTLFQTGAGGSVSNEIATTNTGTTGRICSFVNGGSLTLSGVPPSTVP